MTQTKKTKQQQKNPPNNNHAKLISDRGKIFDTSEIKHSREHELYTVIKVLRSSMLVQGDASSTNCRRCTTESPAISLRNSRQLPSGQEP